MVFDGIIPASKSLMNRWLCVGSYASAARPLLVVGDSSCDDVKLMRAALRALVSRAPIDCGSAGTVLRFMALRASRESGRHRLTGSRRLFERPQAELLKTLRALGVEAEFQPDALVIDSAGWKEPASPLEMDRSVSSQFISSLALNAWGLPFELRFRGSEKSVSDSYFDMTLAVVRQAGMRVTRGPDGLWSVPASQSVTPGEARAESDMSSAFAVAALAAVAGSATFKEFPEDSLQPDVVFVDILKKMGAEVVREPRALSVRKGSLRGVECDLKNCPDLFPVLAALCSLAEGPSKLHGAAHLVHKESNRIANMESLLRLTGRGYKTLTDGLEIEDGSAPSRDFIRRAPPLVFDPVEDHRLVMAAAVLRHAGFDVEILRADCVSKSYPEFLRVAGIGS